MRALNRLGAPALMPLWKAVHDRMSSGRQVSRVKAGPLDEEQRSAVADLPGTGSSEVDDLRRCLPTSDKTAR